MESLKIEVTSDLAGFTDKAMEELHTRVKSYAEEVIQQAAREEQEYRSPLSQVAEITPTHVIEADQVARRIRRTPRRPTRAEATLEVAIAVSCGAAGTLGGMLHSTLEIALFGASCGVGAMLTWFAARRPR